MADALFIIEIVLAWIILTAIQFPLRKEEHMILRPFVFFLKLVLIPLSAVLSASIEWKVAYTHDDILCAVYIAFIGDVVASVIEYIVRRIRAWRDVSDELRGIFDYRIGLSIGLAVCIMVLAFGTVNAENIRMDAHEWQANGLEQEHTFAFASDLHIENSQSMDRLREFCRQVNGSGAEFLILGGDITDELTSYEVMIETYETLSTVDIPVYFIYGNHDRQPSADFVGGRTYSDQQLSDAISGAGITILADEFVQVASDLVLLGREDISISDARKGWSELVDPYGGALIVADHQPYDWEQLKIEVSALQLSGHTHAGQLWPLQTLYGLLGFPVKGEFSYPGTRLYVTPGLGVWDVPLRTDAHCGWELITLHP